MANKNYQTARFSAGQRFTVVILSFILALAIVAGVIYAVTVNNNKIDTAGTYTQTDDTIMFLSDFEQVIVEESDLPKTISERYLIGGSDNDSGIVAFSSDIIQFSAGSLPTGFIAYDGDLSLRGKDVMQFYVNGQYHTNYSTGSQINFNSTTGFSLEINRSYHVEYEGEGDLYYDYRVAIKVNDVWYLSPKENYFEGTTSERQIIDLSALDSGTYQICGFYSLGSVPNPGNPTIRRTDIYNVVFNAVNYVPIPNPPTKEGYTFVGWYFDEALTQLCTSLEVVENTILYSKYIINKHTVTFETNGGSAINTLTVDWGSTVSLASYVPTKTGYNFSGWYTNAGLTTEASASIVVKTDTELFAKYDIKKLSVTLMVDGEVWQVLEVDYGTGVFAVVTELESSTFSLKSFLTQGLVYDDIADESVFIADTVMTLETKSLADQVANIDWQKVLMWSGIGLGSAVVLITVIMLIVSSKKKVVVKTRTKSKKRGK